MYVLVCVLVRMSGCQQRNAGAKSENLRDPRVCSAVVHTPCNQAANRVKKQKKRLPTSAKNAHASTKKSNTRQSASQPANVSNNHNSNKNNSAACVLQMLLVEVALICSDSWVCCTTTLHTYTYGYVYEYVCLHVHVIVCSFHHHLYAHWCSVLLTGFSHHFRCNKQSPPPLPLCIACGCGKLVHSAACLLRKTLACVSFRLAWALRQKRFAFNIIFDFKLKREVSSVDEQSDDLRLIMVLSAKKKKLFGCYYFLIP